MVKVMIVQTNKRYGDSDTLTLRECGFKVGDIVEVDSFCHDGSFYTEAPRDMIPFGIYESDVVSVNKGEFVAL